MKKHTALIAAAALALTALTSVSAPPAHAYVICHDFRACHGPVQPR